MFTHEQIWIAIDRLAESAGYSTSGLAKRAGLDPTSFNKSKRLSPDGKPRWPSTESLSRVLSVTNLNMNEFIAFVEQREIRERADTSIDIDTDMFAPHYKRGDSLGLDTNANVNPGDRILVQLDQGQILIADYISRSNTLAIVHDFLSSGEEKAIKLSEIKALSKILWVRHR